MHRHSEAFSQELQTKWPNLRAWLKERARSLGFSQMRITDTDLSKAHPKLLEWLAKGHHGQMKYLERHADLRADPSRLHPGALRSICLTMPYLRDSEAIDTDSLEEGAQALLMREEERLRHSGEAVISLYARGRDYHKVLRHRLQSLASQLEAKIRETLGGHDPEMDYRVFTDSAPLMEVELARKAGVGWRGKHTLLLNREGGSFFFLGEILINLPLPIDAPTDAHCGSCQACMDVCSTQAIIAPYQLDARRCISYLTIEHRDAIPAEFRRAIGNRIYGCDDCQLVCPWNKYAHVSTVTDFDERHGLGHASLLELWSWTEAQFQERFAGSAIYRIGYERWRRNLAVGMGNALASAIDPHEKVAIMSALKASLPSASPLVAEHIEWALDQYDGNSLK